jgi:hypothetical protein
VSGREFDCIIVAFVRSDGLAFVDLRWDGGLTAKVPGDVVVYRLLVDQVLDYDTALSRGDIPILESHVIPFNDGGVGRCINQICESFSSMNIGVMNAGKKVKVDGTGLVLHGDRVIADGTFVS